MINLRVNDTEQSHLLSPRHVLNTFFRFINSERWAITTSDHQLDCSPVTSLLIDYNKDITSKLGTNKSVKSVFFFFLVQPAADGGEMRVALWALCGQAWRVWAVGLCMKLCVWLCWCVQMLELGRRAWGEDQRLQLGRFYSTDDGCFHSPHTMPSIHTKT